jgi:Flp pilus assembly protein TadG
VPVSGCRLTDPQRRQRCRGDRGEVTATVLMVPLVLLAMMLVVQFALAYYARQVVSGAAQDGAAAAARQHSSPGVGAALAEQLISEGAGSLLTAHSASGSSDGERVYVEASGEVVTVLPFFPAITVTATGSAAIEEFTPEGASP